MKRKPSNRHAKMKHPHARRAVAAGRRRMREEDLPCVTGVLRVSPRGFGFVHVSADEPDVFIPPEDIGGGLSDDTVEIQLTDMRDERGPAGRVVRVVKRAHDEFVGCLSLTDDGYVIRPVRRELPVAIPLADTEHGKDALQGAHDGDWVRAALVVETTSDNAPIYARIVRRIGICGRVTDDLDTIVEEYALPARYASAQEKAASRLEPQTVARRDLRDVVTVTIDPTDAKDFDDALSIQHGPDRGEVTVGVHIADVACYVRQGSELDESARARGLTNYLPGRTIPMLPDCLSSDVCCLREGVDRLAHTVMLVMREKTGEVIRSERFHSVIRVTKRLTVEETARIVESDEAARAGVSSAVVSLVVKLDAIAKKSRARRWKTEQFLPIVAKEYRVLCGGKPLRVQGVYHAEQNPASDLVEEFMLAANEAVAKELERRRIPALYRVHGEPDGQSMANFQSMVRELVRKGNKIDLSTREKLVKFLASLREDDVAGELISMAFLRCLPRAVYSTVPTGHFGLGKEHYCHFTSPIRRYPDLLVHQQLLALDTGAATMAEESVMPLADAVNALEQNADQAAFTAQDRLKLRYLESVRAEHPKEYLEGYVLRAHAEGLQVFLPNVGMIGMLDRGRFGDDRWRYDARTSSLCSHTGQRFGCGSVIYVQLKRIDAVHGDLVLKLAW